MCVGQNSVRVGDDLIGVACHSVRAGEYFFRVGDDFFGVGRDSMRFRAAKMRVGGNLVRADTSAVRAAILEDRNRAAGQSNKAGALGDQIARAETLKIILGAGKTSQPGWISTDKSRTGHHGSRKLAGGARPFRASLHALALAVIPPEID
jgi:hypothetical protein